MILHNQNAAHRNVYAHLGSSIISLDITMTCLEQKERIDVCAFVRLSRCYDHCVQRLPFSFFAHFIGIVQFFRFFNPTSEAITGYIEMGSNADLSEAFSSKTAYVFGCSGP